MLAVRIDRSILIQLVFLVPVIMSWYPAERTTRLEYDVVVNDRFIGLFAAERTDRDTRTDYRLTTNLSARFITRVNFDFIMHSTFENSRLVEADLKRYFNHQLKKSSTVKLEGEKYVIHTDTGTRIHAQPAVYYSSATLYFQEPIGVTHVFSESFGENLPVESLGNHTYSIKLPDGDTNLYMYQNGQVVKAIFQKSLARIELNRK